MAGLAVKDSTAFRKARLDRGLTKEQLAEKADVSYMTVHRAEGGERIYERHALKIAEVLEHPVTALFEVSDAA